MSHSRAARARQDRTAVRAWAWILLAATCAHADAPPDLTALSLEELLEVEVTTVSRQSEPLFEASAAVSVLTAEDLRRAGTTSVPDALRMVAGVQVARVTASHWAVSARGFNNQFANKLLVLVDGRSVYTPLFAGVYWDVQDLLLEDIDRIEVVRGPGATLWGANAVNGVINIITRPARDTTGWLVSGGGGTEERAYAALRYGGAWGGAHYRIGAHWFERDAFAQQTGAKAADDWRVFRAGLRVDAPAGARDSLHVQSTFYDGELGQTFALSEPRPPYARVADAQTDVGGGHVLARWSRALSERAGATLQVYYDHTARRDVFLGETRRTADVDFQHQLGLGARNQLIWGAGFRIIADDLDNGPAVTFDPARRTDRVWSAFAQDEITLPADVRLTLGTKLEHNDYTGVEVQPSARVLWRAGERHALWGALARAVRTPSRLEEDARYLLAVFPAPDTLHLVLLGNRALAADELVAWEAGYRIRPHRTLFLDIAAFYDVYDELGTREPEPPFASDDPPPSHVVVPQRLQNLGFAETAGLEVTASWQATSRWRLAATYSWLDIQLHREPGSQDTNVELAEGSDPTHQVHVRASFDLPGRIELDAALYRVGALLGQRPPIDAYTRVDCRLAWRARPWCDLAVVGQNLLAERHREFGGAVTSVRATEVQRGVYGRTTWRF
jgi:iron complex outermembrane receptor protein